jgi:HJR/Mrr/RecB family endonuclease
VRAWLVELFANAIKRTRDPGERLLAVRWLSQSRDIVASDLNFLDKARRLNSLVDSRATIKALAKRVADAVQSYRHSNLPISVKIAIPATVAAMPFIGGQAAGIAIFGGAFGVPILLLVFLGTTGISAIIEAIVKSPEIRPHIFEIIDVIINDERLRQTSAQMKSAMREQPMDATRFAMPDDVVKLRETLLQMDPFKFERHTMSFFEAAGLEAWVTRKSNDFGVDGFAIHPNGLIIIQCKRNSPDNKVGRPTIQQFKGVIEEQNASRGYVITTSTFTDDAKLSAGLSEKLSLIDIEDLVKWHADPPDFRYSS